MKLIVGLGNPGREYADTRHNIGFIMVDMLKEKLAADSWEDTKWKGVTSRVPSSGVLLLKPLTYMNLSGDSVALIVNFYKLDPRHDLLVISDDIDMEFGKIRFRAKGSHGGQNGLRSIIEKLGTDEFARIKVGIGRNPRFSVSDWVLSKLSPSERDILCHNVYPDIQKKVEEWMSR